MSAVKSRRVSEPDKSEPQSAPETVGSSYFEKSFTEVFDFIQFKLPPGPRFIKLRYIVNLQKGSVGLVMLLLMLKYNNFSLGAWTYLLLHGSYGLFWITKDLTYPDKSFEVKQTIL